MNQKEKLFFDKLKDVFIGTKIEGESGFINLMRIKSSYFDVIFKELAKEIEEKTKDFPDFREELFNELYSFFKVYFSESGSIYFSYTPLKSKIYEKVYTNQKDVALFWKTQMLYYVKTDKLWKNLTIDFDEDGVSYKINFDVSKLEHKKGNEKRKIIYKLKEIKNNEITFIILYSEKGRKTKTVEMLKTFKNKKILIDEEKLNKIFRIFEKQNEVDFFINKNAEAFLKEQFDLWLKNYLFDDESDFSEKRLKELKALKEIAYKVIDFVAQFEDELVKIWNKPKFVLNSNYIITLDRIANKKDGIKVIEKIIKHNGFSEQINEWKDLGILKDFDNKKLLITTLEGKDLSKEYQFLPIDTKYFDEDIKSEILSLFDNLDEELDGWLIHSENYQALKTILPKFQEKMQTIYIDPPFNLGSDADFLYNVNYKDANWITLLENRLTLARDLLNEKGSIFVRCDYNGNMFVRLLMNQIFGAENFRNEITIAKSKEFFKTMTHIKKFLEESESLFFFSKSNNLIFNPLYRKKKNPSKYEPFLPARDKTYQDFRIIYGKKYYSPKGRKWGVKQNDIERLLKEKRLVNENGKWYLITYEEPLKDVWIDFQGYSRKWGFKTENSEIFIKRAVQSTSNEGDLILDFFLGSGTTTAVAHKLGRKWIGVEMGEHFFSVVLPRMKKVLAYDKSGISKEKDVKENYNEKKAGGFFKYYDLEQYEQTLRKAVYKESSPFFVFFGKSIYQQYVFLKDFKLLEAMELDYKNNKIKIDFSAIYPNIDLAETISCITGKAIKKIEKDAVVLEDGERVKYDNIDFNLIKPLIWW
ncbi:MAG: site-specific DNA-methyltransferase [Promethearchaeota archaeon]